MNRPCFSLTRRGALLAAAAAALPGTRAWAEAPYPNKPIKLVLPTAPGSAVDLLARQLGPLLTAALGQPIVIDNVPGSANLIGTLQMLRAPHDGYTLGFQSSTYAAMPSLYKLPFDPAKDVKPVTVMTSGPLLLVVNPRLAASNLHELLALAKSRPEASLLSYGSGGIGTTVHVAAELMTQQSGVRMLHVPYKGAGQYATDLIGGQIDCGFLALGQALPYVRSNRLRAIGLSTKARLPNMPEFTPLAELGLPGFDVDAWVAMVAPGQVPPAVMDRLNRVTVGALRSREMTQFLYDNGGNTIGNSLPEASAMLVRELDRYAKVIKANDIKVS